ncbi:hypothetical protein [Antarcticirhabdus aurantiaca]|uniref:Uncharacterized protein n=1 Tax=Antarcticirhabdus aurantiaca TaxID=2606717 RepID=A0ACD4NS78_9HYPH|nr:hypothetical protein [Antarcticirhabdus aurantiaca]WAJ29495.1 hypothetical protein OXU80_04470 [Jeongeuplla avenae]
MFELLKIAHLIMMAMASGSTLSSYVVLRASVGREDEAGLALARRTLAELTTFAVGFVWISGAALLWSRAHAPEPAVSAWFYAKLAFVALFTLAHAAQRLSGRRLRGGPDRVPARRGTERWASVAWLMSLLAICLAVVSFE